MLLIGGLGAIHIIRATLLQTIRVTLVIGIITISALAIVRLPRRAVSRDKRLKSILLPGEDSRNAARERQFVRRMPPIRVFIVPIGMAVALLQTVVCA